MSEELVNKVTDPSALTKGAYAMIRGMPCKLTEVNHVKLATVNGNKKLHLAGLHVFTGVCVLMLPDFR